MVEQAAAASTPSSGKSVIYPKTDGKWYFKDDAGVEKEISTTDGVASAASQAEVDAMSISTKFLHPNHKKIINGTYTALPSATSVNITGIPAGVRRVILACKEISFNAAANPLVQIGDSGGIETSGYLSVAGDYVPTANHTSSTAGFVMMGAATGASVNVAHLIAILQLLDAATFTWACYGHCVLYTTPTTGTNLGTKSLSAELTQLTLTTVAGTSTFDAGNYVLILER